MSALNDNVQVLRVAVHVVLLPVDADNLPYFILELSIDCVFTGVHVSYIGTPQPPGEFLPSTRLHVVRFTNVDAPDLACAQLQDLEQVKNLLIMHPPVEILNVKCDKIRGEHDE